jgi:hypothetical protein
MSLSSRKLYLRRSGVTEEINLYTTVAETLPLFLGGGEHYGCVRFGGATLYFPVDGAYSDYNEYLQITLKTKMPWQFSYRPLSYGPYYPQYPMVFKISSGNTGGTWSANRSNSSRSNGFCKGRFPNNMTVQRISSNPPSGQYYEINGTRYYFIEGDSSVHTYSIPRGSFTFVPSYLSSEVYVHYIEEDFDPRTTGEAHA